MAQSLSCQFRSIYSKNFNLQLIDRNGVCEARCITISVSELNDTIQIKAKDNTEFSFNYTGNVDLRTFDGMRNEQSLDIDFNEFKSNLVDMLEQVAHKDMFLKCDFNGTNSNNNDNKCKLIFYGKSRIKSLIFLTIDLQLTNQQEIFDEMYGNIRELQAIKANLTSQLQSSRKILQTRDSQIERLTFNSQKLEKQFLDHLQNLHSSFTSTLQQCTANLLHRILQITQKLLKLTRDIDVVKSETALKSNSSARLLQSMEMLRLESIETATTISDLQRENSCLQTTKYKNERVIGDLKMSIVDQNERIEQLQKQIETLERDLQQATLIIAQKSTTNDELGKDLVQANQMIVNFNNNYDVKAREIEELKNILSTKDQIISEQKLHFHDLQRQYDEYKLHFNVDEFNRITHELFLAKNKIQQLDKQNAETIKLNELLTRKLSSGNILNNTARGGGGSNFN